MALSAKVDATGISAPSFDEVLDYLQESYRAIYGADIYLEADSQDGQLMGVFATALHDCIDSSIQVYNDFSPSTAIGAGLSSVVKVNGISRQNASNSTAVVRIVGQPGIQITNGVISDSLNLGTSWALPPLVTVPASGPSLGEINVTATCQQRGSIAAAANTLTHISNPQFGWQEVNNPAPAALGAAIETDAMLRRRQARSASLPAQATVDAIYAAVADVAGVGRVAVYQNDTAFLDVRGIPPHSIAVVHQGGNITNIGEAVALKKPPGVQTYGYLDPVSGLRTYVIVFDDRGMPNQIYLNPMVQIPVVCRMVLQATPAFIESTRESIKSAMVTFYNNLAIAEPAYLTRAYGPANLMTQDAEDATGLSEAQLDLLTNTYHVIDLAHAREGMTVANPIVSGTYWLRTHKPQYFGLNDVIYITCDNGLFHRATIYSYDNVSDIYYFTPAISSSSSVGQLILKVGDLKQDEFWGAYSAVPSNIAIEILPAL